MSGEVALSKEARSPESTVSKGSLSSSSNDRSSGDDLAPLRIDTHPPSHVFSGAWFDFQIHSHLQDKAADLIVDLHLCDAHGTPSNGPLRDVGRPAARLILDPPGPISLQASKQDDGQFTTVRCQLRSTEGHNLSEQANKYRIRIHLKGSTAPDFKKTPRLFTNTIQIVTAKLTVVQEQQWESIFYKDEGGRDKCMSVTISLRGHDDALLRNQRVPLKWTLLYESDQYLQVMRQETLRVLGPKRQYIDPETAQVVLRFRIEDVSKNHQGQDFRVEVSADSTKFPHVGPACTPAVNVRSKRNKRNKPTPSKLDPASQSSARGMGPSPLTAPLQDSSIPPRPPFPQTRALHTGPMPMGPPTMSPPLTLLDDHRMEGADVTRLKEAMKGVIRWTEEVVNGLYPLQWQIIGYAQFPDGSVDYNRPYHSMPNPNACISNVLAMYSNETREHLGVLLSAVEGARSPDHGSRVGGKVDSTEMFPTGEYRLPALQQQRAYSGSDHAAKASPKYPYMESQSTAASSSYSSSSRPPMPSPYAMTKKQRVDTTSTAYRHHTDQHMHPHHTPQHRQQMPTTSRLDNITPARLMPQTAIQQPHHPPITDLEEMHDQQAEENFEIEGQQANVEYILAKQYKSLRTGNVLGFPAYNANKEILGFYRESSMKVGIGQFVPISRHKDEFGPSELTHATRILEEAIAKKSQAVHAMKDWGSLYSLIDHALVYDWSKDMSGNDDSSNGISPPSFD